MGVSPFQIPFPFPAEDRSCNASLNQILKLSSHRLPFCLLLSFSLATPILLVPLVVILVVATILLIVGSRWCCFRPFCRVAAEVFVLSGRLLLLSHSVLSYTFASIDPIRVHVNRGRKIIDVALKFLAADFAVKVTDACFFVQLHLHRLFVVTEEAGELCVERTSFLGAGWLARGLLSFTLSSISEVDG